MSWQPVFVVVYLALAVPAYLLSTPETTSGFESVAKQFRVVAMRDSKPVGTTLEALRRPDPKLSFLLPTPVVEITGGDLHKATVVQSGADWQVVQYEYGNTSSTTSRYRAYKDRIEPLSHRLEFHPGIMIIMVALMLPAWLLAVAIAWLLRRAYPRRAAQAAPEASAPPPPPKRLDRFSFYLRWFAVIAVAAGFAFPFALKAWEWLARADWAVLGGVAAFVLCFVALAYAGRWLLRQPRPPRPPAPAVAAAIEPEAAPGPGTKPFPRLGDVPLLWRAIGGFALAAWVAAGYFRPVLLSALLVFCVLAAGSLWMRSLVARGSPWVAAALIGFGWLLSVVGLNDLILVTSGSVLIGLYAFVPHGRVSGWWVAVGALSCAAIGTALIYGVVWREHLHLSRNVAAEALLSLSPARTAVENFHKEHGRLPATAAEGGIAAAFYPSSDARESSYNAGELTAVLKGRHQGKAIVLRAIPSGKELVWQCSGRGFPAEGLPKMCRGN